MKEIFFRKMSGAGNDFIIVDGRNQDFRASSQVISKLSNRNIIGCDQFVVINNSHRADCFIEIYNADGSKSGMCGNATRCVASILMKEKSLEQITIETSSKILKCWKVGHQIAVEMGAPIFASTYFFFEDLKFICVDMGNPHAVCIVNNIPDDETFNKIGKSVEGHKFFPKKTNVEFAKIVSNQIIEVRVFERGVGETLACGSGACAVAAAAIKYKLVKNHNLLIRFRGGDLTIIWPNEESQIVMIGDYQELFTGNFKN